MTSNVPHIADGYEAAARWALRLAEARPEGAEHLALESWLNADPANADRLDDILQSWAAVEAYAAAEPIMALREEALAATRIEEQEDQHGWSWQGALVAATLVLCFIGASLWLTLQPTNYDTAIGERRVVTLDDGSTLSLDAETQVSVDLSDDRRELSLGQGRAKFDVAKDPLRPFTVRVGSKVVVAIGTSFSVERIGDALQVILYEGRIAILDGPGAQPRTVTRATGVSGEGTAISLAPRQSVTLSLAEPMASAMVSTVDVDRALSWESGQLVFIDEPLASVVARANRYVERPLRIGDDRARRIKVSGVFRAGETEGLLQGLEAAFGARIVQEPNAVAIFSSPE